MNTRRILPSRREASTFDLRHGNHEFTVSIGYHEGLPVEVFVAGVKAGSELEATARDGAILLSLAMQYGIPLDMIRRAITREHDETASTVVGAVVDLLCEENAS